MPEDKPILAREIGIQSIVSSATTEGAVQLQWPKDTKGAQLNVTEAMQHALAILECAAHATVDAFLFRFLTEQIQASPEGAAKVLNEFREYCLRRRPENWREEKKSDAP